MSILLSVVLDSGAFLTPIDKEEIQAISVGYFKSFDTGYDALVYADGMLIEYLDFPPGKIFFEHLDVFRNVRQGITVSSDLNSSLLNLDTLYGSQVKIRDTVFDLLLQFSSGHFSSSMIKARSFMEEGDSKSKIRVARISHNVAALYILEDGESFQIKSDDSILWSSDSGGFYAKSEIRIEIIADNSTTLSFYKNALNLPQGQRALIPNWGDPPVYRTHGSGGGVNR